MEDEKEKQLMIAAFDECIKLAIKMGRKYMGDTTMTKKPTDAEWNLALLLFKGVQIE